MTTAWKPEHMQRLSYSRDNVLPPLNAAELEHLSDRLLYWDFWPVLTADGKLAQINGIELWMSLAAPIDCEPGERHFHARIRLHTRCNGQWQDCGNLLPDGYSLGSQEWSGSAIYTPANDGLSLYYTAVGRAERPGPSFEQRLVQTTGKVVSEGNHLRVDNWCNHTESVVADGQRYAVANQVTGEPGFVTAFRDPYYFLDPRTGVPHLLFTATMGNPVTRYSGAIGIAEPASEGATPWQLCSPLMTADYVNTEMERAHVIFYQEHYYLFWSTQRHTFEPGSAGPNGLYGAVAEALTGEYRLLNGSGLVLTNPEHSPAQSYAWQVMPDLRVVSFVDRIPDAAGLENSLPDKHKFVGTVAPQYQITLEGDRARLRRSHEQ